MHAGLIYLSLHTTDKIFQRKISFRNEALQFVDGSLSSGSKYSDYFGILHTVHFILGENSVGLFLRNAENTLVFRVDVLEAELISMKKVLLFS